MTDAVRSERNAELNDRPYGERDFGAFELDGSRYFWKIDLYERAIVKHRPSRGRFVVDARPTASA